MTATAATQGSTEKPKRRAAPKAGKAKPTAGQKERAKRQAPTPPATPRAAAARAP